MQYGYLTISLISILALGACGGSSSGNSSGTTAFKSFSEMPANGTTVISGEAVTASYAVNAGVATVSNQRGPNASKMSITNANGKQQVVSIEASGSSVSFDARKGEIVSERDLTSYTSQNKQDNAKVSSNYNYQTFGAWVTGNGTASGTVGAGSYGNKTNSNKKAVVATYSGQALGISTNPSDSKLGVVVSDAKVRVTDFENYSFSTENSLLLSVDGTPEGILNELNLTGKGKISNARLLKGSVKSDSTLALSGSVSGSFYGPNANEVGGTFRTSNGSGAAYIGSFGGERP